MPRIALVFLMVLASQAAQAFPTYATGGFRGANLMSSEEVKAHISKLMSMQSFEQCEAYMATHEQDLQQRAVAQHVTLPEKGGDPCKIMRTFGRIQ